MPRRLPGQEACGREIGAACAGCGSPLRRSLCGASADEPSAAVERGRYVATAANCISCHTRDNGAAYAGGRLARDAPRPDPLDEHHAGSGDRHRNVDRGGPEARVARRHRRPTAGTFSRPFHTPFYTRLSDGDIADLYAFLRTLKPIHYVPPTNGQRVPHALADGDMEGAEPRRRCIPAGRGALGGMEPRRIPRAGSRALRACHTAARLVPGDAVLGTARGAVDAGRGHAAAASATGMRSTCARQSRASRAGRPSTSSTISARALACGPAASV